MIEKKISVYLPNDVVKRLTNVYKRKTFTIPKDVLVGDTPNHLFESLVNYLKSTFQLTTPENNNQDEDKKLLIDIVCSIYNRLKKAQNFNYDRAITYGSGIINFDLLEKNVLTKCGIQDNVKTDRIQFVVYVDNEHTNESLNVLLNIFGSLTKLFEFGVLTAVGGILLPTVVNYNEYLELTEDWNESNLETQLFKHFKSRAFQYKKFIGILTKLYELPEINSKLKSVYAFYYYVFDELNKARYKTPEAKDISFLIGEIINILETKLGIPPTTILSKVIEIQTDYLNLTIAEKYRSIDNMFLTQIFINILLQKLLEK